MTDLSDFVAIAKKQIYEPNTPRNFLPTYLDLTKEELGWTAPAYAPITDIPKVGEYLAAALVVESAELTNRVKLPPNMKELSEVSSSSEHQEGYIAHFKTTAAIIEFIRAKSELSDAMDVMMKRMFKNWEATCNKLPPNS